jgi:hypothetical protein
MNHRILKLLVNELESRIQKLVIASFVVGISNCTNREGIICPKGKGTGLKKCFEETMIKDSNIFPVMVNHTAFQRK